MNIVVYLPRGKGTEEHQLDALNAMYAGIHHAGFSVTTRYCDEYDPMKAPDIAVTWGVLKNNVPASWNRAKPFVGQLAVNKHVLILEKGFIDRENYFHAGWDGLNGHATFPAPTPGADERLERLGWWRDLKPRGQSILVIGQVPWDATVQHHDHVKWLQDVVSELQTYCQRPIIVRPHPLAIDHTPIFAGTEHSVGRPLEEDLANAYAVVTYNSSTAVQAAFQSSAYIFTFDKGSMAWPIGNKLLSMLDEPYRPNAQALRDWAARVAYAQWTLDEMQTGEAWRSLATVLPQEKAAA